MASPATASSISMMKISASEQVAAWLCGLLRRPSIGSGWRSGDWPRGRADIKGLQGTLEGFNRHRIGGLRIIHRQISGNEIRLENANTRDAVDELLLSMNTMSRFLRIAASKRIVLSQQVDGRLG